jgi:2,4-dienoyl-CoA reductase (NADPH2)
LAARVPNRAELGDMIRNQVNECRRLGVTIEYGVEATVDAIAARQPDHVVVATGSAPQRPWWVAPDVTNVCDARDVVAGTAEPAGSIVVIDEIGFHNATSVAELLADRGNTVEIVTPGMVVGQDLGVTLDMEQWWMRAAAKGIVQSTDLVPMSFDGTTLSLLQHQTGVDVLRTPDWVVLAVPGAPVDALYHELRAAGWSVRRVGDCVAPRRAHAAIVEGERAGAELTAVTP